MIFRSSLALLQLVAAALFGKSFFFRGVGKKGCGVINEVVAGGFGCVFRVLTRLLDNFPPPNPPPPPRARARLQVDERHAYLCAAAPLKEDMEYIRNALLTATFKVKFYFKLSTLFAICSLALVAFCPLSFVRREAFLRHTRDAWGGVAYFSFSAFTSMA